jgi:RNA polymerase sigma factor (sigma-70 family)
MEARSAMSHGDESWRAWLQRIRAGDEDACREFWQQYSPLVARIAQRHLAGAMRRRVDPDSIALSACRTFFRRAQQGHFELPDAESLWRLLCAVTLNKIRMRRRDHLRKKRALDREVPLDVPAGSPADFRGFSTGEPRPEDVVEFEDQLELLVGQLEEDAQRILEFKMQDCTNHEIAEKLRCSERTVRRKMDHVRSQLARLLAED